MCIFYTLNENVVTQMPLHHIIKYCSLNYCLQNSAYFFPVVFSIGFISLRTQRHRHLDPAYRTPPTPSTLRLIDQCVIYFGIIWHVRSPVTEFCLTLYCQRLGWLHVTPDRSRIEVYSNQASHLFLRFMLE